MPKPPAGSSPQTTLPVYSTAIRLSPALVQHIDKHRDLSGLSRSAFIRQLIVEHMRSHNS